MIPRKISPWVALFCLLAMGGCQQADLHHGLEEMEADQVLNVLHQNGIKADKVKEVQGQEVSWKVSVPSRDLARARQILITHNMPRRKELGLSGVYKEKGLIPTPDEQKARYLLALKGEIINSLEKIPGVVDADVVLNIPAEDEFSELRAAERRPTASVVVRTEGDFIRGEEVGEGKVQRFVANSVPNLNPNDVAVIITRGGMTPPATAAPSLWSPAPGSPAPVARSAQWVNLAGVKLESGSVRRFKGYFIGLLSLLVIVAASLLVTIVRLNRLGARLQAGAPLDAVPLEGGRRPLLGGGAEGGVEGTFDLGRKERAG